MVVFVFVVGGGGGGAVVLFYLSFVIRYSFVPVTNILISHDLSSALSCIEEMRKFN